MSDFYHRAAKECEDPQAIVDLCQLADEEVIVLRQSIKELEGALECALKTVDRLDDADLGFGDDNYCCECNAQDNINMLNGEYLCAECIEAGGLGE